MPDILSEDASDNPEVDFASKFVEVHLLQPCGSDAAQKIGTRMTYVESAMRFYDSTNNDAAKKIFLEALRRIPVIMQTEFTAAKAAFTVQFGDANTKILETRVNAVIAQLQTWLQGK